MLFLSQDVAKQSWGFTHVHWRFLWSSYRCMMDHRFRTLQRNIGLFPFSFEKPKRKPEIFLFSHGNRQFGNWSKFHPKTLGRASFGRPSTDPKRFAVETWKDVCFFHWTWFQTCGVYIQFHWTKTDFYIWSFNFIPRHTLLGFKMFQAMWAQNWSIQLASQLWKPSTQSLDFRFGSQELKKNSTDFFDLSNVLFYSVVFYFLHCNWSFFSRIVTFCESFFLGFSWCITYPIFYSIYLWV